MSYVDKYVKTNQGVIGKVLSIQDDGIMFLEVKGFMLRITEDEIAEVYNEVEQVWEAQKDYLEPFKNFLKNLK